MTLDTPTYVGEIKDWQTELEERLRSPDGGLTLVGLDWLAQGKNSVGSNPDNMVSFPTNTTPENVGSLKLENGVVTFKVNEGIIATVNGNRSQRWS